MFCTILRRSRNARLPSPMRILAPGSSCVDNAAARRLLRLCRAERLCSPGDLFRFSCIERVQELGQIKPGALRAMADEYGALVLIAEESFPGGSRIALSVRLPESHFFGGQSL